MQVHIESSYTCETVTTVHSTIADSYGNTTLSIANITTKSCKERDSDHK